MEKNSGVSFNFSRRIFIFLPLVLFAFVLFYELPALADAPSRVTLDADRVSYDDMAGRATAEGNAVLTYRDTTIRAGRIDYDVSANIVNAFPEPDGWVSLESMGRTVIGRGLEYDLNTREGVMSGVRSSVRVGDGILHITGDGMQVLPYDLALERGLVRHRLRDGPDHIGIARNVSVTTCALDRPHYRLETRSLVVIPGRRVIVRRPRLYMGNTFIFTYPMDYMARIDRREVMHNFIPYIEYNDTKGIGIVFSGGFELWRGTASLGAGYWTSTGLDWMAGVEQSLGGGFSIESSVEYVWNEEWQERRRSPRARLSYERYGWETAVRVAWNEYLEEQKDAVTQFRGLLDRKPEFSVLSPWYRDYTMNESWFRLGATAGRYWERTSFMLGETTTRYGVMLQNYIEQPINRDVTFFSNTTYDAWFYNDIDDSRQGTLNCFMGLRYNFGVVELMSGYERRFVWGESPMLWDRYSDRERFHQKARFPFGRELFLVARGSYDTTASKIDEVNYTLQWVTDCMRWELNFRNDRSSGSNSRINLRVLINAFPNAPLSLGERRQHNPFDPPDIPGRR